MKNNRSRKRVTGIMLLLLMGSALVLMGAWWPPRFLKRLTSHPLTAGTAAPQFELESLNGEMISLEQFKGKPVLLNFWSSG